MDRIIPYGRQSITAEDIRAVVDVLKGDWLTCGPAVERFEHALADYCGAKHVIVVSNGTAALHVALLAANIKPGDRVLTSPNTFLASANCVEYVGAHVDFVDICPDTYNMNPKLLESAWTANTKAVIAVDFAGQPCIMDDIALTARKNNAIVIEDAAHSLGSKFTVEGVEYKVGSHPWADMTTFSFHPVKTITTGEGGAIATNDDELAKQCRLFRSHGMQKTRPDEPWYYEMQMPGYNYRITDIQCALGMSQLNRLDQFIERRQEIVSAYHSAFESLEWLTLPIIPSFGHRAAWHLFVCQFDFAAIGKTRFQVMGELRDRGVGTQVHYIPVHLQPYYRNKYGYGSGKCPMAESYYEKCLSLPLFPGMTNEDVSTVIQAVKGLV